MLRFAKCFIIGHEVPEDDPDCGTFSTGPNLWPKSLPEADFRIPIMDYQARMVELVKVLLRILARGLPQEWNCPPDVLDALAENNPSIPMRLLHYGPQPIRDERQFGGRSCLLYRLRNSMSDRFSRRPH